MGKPHAVLPGGAQRPHARLHPPSWDCRAGGAGAGAPSQSGGQGAKRRRLRDGSCPGPALALTLSICCFRRALRRTPGITAPPEYGGLGAGYSEHCIAMEVRRWRARLEAITAPRGEGRQQTENGPWARCHLGAHGFLDPPLSSSKGCSPGNKRLPAHCIVTGSSPPLYHVDNSQKLACIVPPRRRSAGALGPSACRTARTAICA